MNSNKSVLKVNKCWLMTRDGQGSDSLCVRGHCQLPIQVNLSIFFTDLLAFI